MDSISVLLIDDSPAFLQLVVRFLRHHPEVEILGIAQDGEEALRLAAVCQPAVVLVDLNMPGLSGLEVVTRLRTRQSHTGIIALTLWDTSSYRRAAEDAGTDDFVPKATLATDLMPAIRRVAAGRRKPPKAAHDATRAPAKDEHTA